MWWSEQLDWECFSAPVSSNNESYFYVFPCTAWWRVRSWSWMAAATTLLDEVYAFLPAARWRALSWSWTAAATTSPTILPPTSGLVQRRCRRGAQLDGAFAFNASRRRLRGKFGPGLRRVAQLDCELAFYASPPPTSCLALRRRRRGGLRDWESTFHRLSGSPTLLLAWLEKGNMDNESASLRLSPLTSGKWRLGWKDCCCRWLWPVLLAISKECSARSPSRVLCCRLCLTFTKKNLHRKTKNKQNRHGKKWPFAHRFEALSAGPAGPVGAA